MLAYQANGLAAAFSLAVHREGGLKEHNRPCHDLGADFTSFYVYHLLEKELLTIQIGISQTTTLEEAVMSRCN